MRSWLPSAARLLEPLPPSTLRVLVLNLRGDPAEKPGETADAAANGNGNANGNDDARAAGEDTARGGDEAGAGADAAPAATHVAAAVRPPGAHPLHVRGRVRGVDLAAFTLADYRIAAADASFDYRGSHCRWLLPHMLNASDLVRWRRRRRRARVARPVGSRRGALRR